MLELENDTEIWIDLLSSVTRDDKTVHLSFSNGQSEVLSFSSDQIAVSFVHHILEKTGVLSSD